MTNEEFKEMKKREIDYYIDSGQLERDIGRAFLTKYLDWLVKKIRGGGGKVEKQFDPNVTYNMFFNSRGYGQYIHALDLVTRYMIENNIYPSSQAFLDGACKYSIAYDIPFDRFTVVHTHFEFMLPLFNFFREEDAQKVIMGCQEELKIIFTYQIFAGGKV